MAAFEGSCANIGHYPASEIDSPEPSVPPEPVYDPEIDPNPMELPYPDKNPCVGDPSAWNSHIVSGC